MTDLGADWKPDRQGILTRTAARVLVISRESEVLLLHGRDGHDPAHQWWFTVGGGVAPGESLRGAAARELLEETGLRPTGAGLVGPVLYREADFVFVNVHARQQEWFYLLYLDEAPAPLEMRGRTGSEKRLVDDASWFDEAGLQRLERRETVYPLGLSSYLASWWHGWDGRPRAVIERRSPG